MEIPPGIDHSGTGFFCETVHRQLPFLVYPVIPAPKTPVVASPIQLSLQQT